MTDNEKEDARSKEAKQQHHSKPNTGLLDYNVGVLFGFFLPKYICIGEKGLLPAYFVVWLT